MKVLVNLAVVGVVAVLLIACGPSSSEVEEVVATAVAESEERTEQRIQAELEVEEVVSTAVAESEKRTERRIRAELEAQARASDEEVGRVAWALEDFGRQTIASVCETDYGTTVLWHTVFLLIAYLGGQDLTLADVLTSMDGMAIDESYKEFAVCNVEDGRWVFNPQPDKIQFDRQSGDR